VRTLEGRLEMDSDDLIPIALLHGLEGLVSEDSGVGNEDVDSLGRVERSVESGGDDGGRVFS